MDTLPHFIFTTIEHKLACILENFERCGQLLYTHETYRE